MVRRSPRCAGKPKGDLASCSPRPIPGKKATVEDHVKEMIATIGENMTRAPHGSARGAGRRRRSTTCITRSAEASARSACWSRSKATATKPTICPRSAARSPCTSPPQARLRSILPAFPPRCSSARRRSSPTRTRASRRRCWRRSSPAASRAYAKDNCLLEQSVHPRSRQRPSTQALKEAEGKAGAPVKIAGFVRYALGEGIEKKEDDFAAEVAAAASG